MMTKAKLSRNNSNNSSGFLPSSLRIIGSCLKTVSANATSVASTVKSAAASISAVSDDHKEQVTWAGFDKLELSSSLCRHVLLLGYQNGFQVVDVDDASKFSELVSKRDDGPVTFLQMQPIPLKSSDQEGFQKSHPLLLVVGCRNESKSSQGHSQSHFCGLEKEKHVVSYANDSTSCLRAVHFYSLRSLSYVHVLRFRSNVCIVRCNPRIVAVGLTKQIYCFDALTLEKQFSVLTYPIPQVVGHEKVGVNIGCGPMAVGPRWLAYASNDTLFVNKGRLSPQTLSPAAGASLSEPPSSGRAVAHYALESSKHLAAGIATLGDKGYKTLSKYCHELLPDGSNSPQTSGSRTGGSTRTETDIAGVVVVMDLVSRTMICQFRAHSTPISALCFDPSGTLLVTASVHGNSINVFRIMPCRNISGSASTSYNWSSSSVHLYKFRRGIRAAIIQDICFSQYSQWIAVVSSKGTCHIFVLSPFGGDVGFQNLNGDSGEASIAPVLTLPWWSSSICTINQQSFLPPPPVTLSVVSRIKDKQSGFLNTVSRAAVPMSGQASVPAGAHAAVFHDSLRCESPCVQKNVRSLEHLLVYTPSGHVVQHEIQPLFRGEGDDYSRSDSGSLMLSQDGELSININPVRWWDVCRRFNWSEQEDSISEILLHEQASARYGNPISGTYGPDLSTTNSKFVRNRSMMSNSSRSHESPRWYLCNAEIQYRGMKLPEWQKTKISFGKIGSSRIEDYANGECEIEKLPVSEVEIRRKDLLPVFGHFHSMKSALHDRSGSLARHANSFNLDHPRTRYKNDEETIICHSKPASYSSTESSDGGSSRGIDHPFDLDQLNMEQTCAPYHQNASGYYVGNLGNAVDQLSVLKSKFGAGADIMPPDFQNSAAVVSCVEANIPVSHFQSVSVGVMSNEEPSQFDAQKGEADGPHGNGSKSSQTRDSLHKGMLNDDALSKTFEPVIGLKEIEDANNAMGDRSVDSNMNHNEGFLCSLLSINEEGCENASKAEGRGTTAATSEAAVSIKPSFREGNFNEEDQQNSSWPMFDFGILEPAGDRETTMSMSRAATSCSTRCLKGNLNQEEYHLLSPISGSCHTTSEAAEEQRAYETTATAKGNCSSSSVVSDYNQVQDMVGGVLASPENTGLTSSTKVHLVHQVEDIVTDLGPQLEDGMKRIEQAQDRSSIEATSISRLSSSDSSSNGNLNQVKNANSLGGSCEFLEEATGGPEVAAFQKDTEVVNNASVSRLDLVEEDMIRAIFPVEEYRNDACSSSSNEMMNEDGDTGNACSLSRKDDMNEVQDDMLGDIFPFSEEGLFEN